MENPTRTEPVVTTAAAVAAATAIIALLVAFGVPLTQDQRDAILALVAVAAPLVAAIIARRLTRPKGAVVEYDDGQGVVRAGEGSELATGTPIREAGSLDTDAVPRHMVE